MPANRFEPSQIKNKEKREEIARKQKREKRQAKLKRRLALAKVESGDPAAKKACTQSSLLLHVLTYAHYLRDAN